MYFSKDEVERRTHLLKEQLELQDVDAVILIARGAGPMSNEHFYFLPIDLIAYGYSILLVFRDGEPIVMAPHLQIDSYRRRSTISDCRIVGEDEDPASAVGRILVERGLSSGRIGWRPAAVPATWYVALTSMLPDVGWVDFSQSFRDIWSLRSAEEALAVRQSAQIADAAYAHLVNHIKPGMTEFDVVAEFEHYAVRHGANRNFTLVASGPISHDQTFPQLTSPSRRKLDRGDGVLLEMTPAVSGYWSQLARMISVATPNPLAQEMRQVCSDATKAAVSVLKNGCTIGAAGQAIEQSVHRARYSIVLPMGHCCGIELVHDRLIPSSNRVLRTDDTIIIHPKIVSPNHQSRFFWGETYRITETGCERLNAASDTLAVAHEK